MNIKILILFFMLGISAMTYGQKAFDLTSGKKMELDRSKFEGSWVSTEMPSNVKLNICFRTEHFKGKISNYYADVFIIKFVKLIENGVDIAVKYPVIETAMSREGATQRLVVTDPRSETVVYYEFKPMPNGNLLFTSQPSNMNSFPSKGKLLFENGKSIILTKSK